MFRASFRSQLTQYNTIRVSVNALGISENSKKIATLAAAEVLHIQNVRNMLCVRFDAQCSSPVLRFPHQALDELFFTISEVDALTLHTAE
jgi:hypothetical protein